MNRTYNSVGSNVFFEFGNQKEIVLPNGRKCFQKEWSIWLSWTSWRITQYNKYIIASGEGIEVNIQSHLEKLIGNRLLSFIFISEFLDIQLDFENGFQIKTFFNRFDENQWLLFFPNSPEIILDCSSQEAIESVQSLAKCVDIKNQYVFPAAVSKVKVKVKEILFSDNKISKLVCTNDFVIDFGESAWRLRRENRYCTGYKDYYFSCLDGRTEEPQNKLRELVGRKLKQLSTDPSGMDINLEFDEGYILELFSHAQTDQWKVFRNSKIILYSKSIESDVVP